MKNVLLPMMAMASLLIASAAHAQGLHAVKPLSGYQCEMLNLTEQQMMSRRTRVPVREAPRDSARVVGIAPATVAINDQVPAQNGYLQAINAAGRSVWIAADIVKPYHSEGDPTAKCVPSVMSNGMIGFDYPHS